MSGVFALAPEIPPRLYRIFLISTYITLAFSCACLVYAEWDLLPEAWVLAGIIVVLLGAAWWCEGRWSLSLTWSNVLGGLIAVVTVVWVVVQWMRPSGGLLRSLPFPVSLLPYVGPLLMLLLPAKMFRPKAVTDFWGLQGIGLVCVALACALADDVYFGVLLVAYLLSGLWNLGLFLIYRERLGRRSPGPMPNLPRPRQVVAWALPVAGLALVVFMLVPRSANTWELTREGRRMEVGMAEEPAIDLNHDGTFELNRDVAFEVFVQDGEGNPKRDLPTDLRWRGRTFRYYYNGRWSDQQRDNNSNTATVVLMSPPGFNPAGNPPTGQLPFFGPEQIQLTYVLRAKNLAQPFVLDPVQIHPSGQIPLITIHRESRFLSWQMNAEGIFLPGSPLPREGGRYRQVSVLPPDNRVGPAVPKEQGNRNTLREPSRDLPELGAWTRELLKQIAVSDSRVAEALADKKLPDDLFEPRHNETIARALEAFLSNSAEFKYSLTLTRTNPNLDPVYDFLFHTRTGHCSHFATALAVMLKSLRIPTRIVLGFRGCDARGDGYYDVRQSHAHAWVECFVLRREAPPPHGMHLGRDSWHWITLDPSPMEAAAASQEANSRWWNNSSWDRHRLFRDLILNYTPERREQVQQLIQDTAEGAWASLKRNLTASGPAGMRARLAAVLTGLLFGVAAVVLIRTIWRRVRPQSKPAAPLAPETAFHRRMLAHLARVELRPTPTQTPEEFAATVTQKLRNRTHGAELANIVDSTTHLFYRVRFGGIPLQESEAHSVNAALERLETTLTPSAN